jgi:hypothetical protein
LIPSDEGGSNVFGKQLFPAFQSLFLGDPGGLSDQRDAGGSQHFVHKRDHPQETTGTTNTITEVVMTMHFALQPLLALIAGVLILIMPRLLN